jgi:hypothetical protein
MIRMPGPLPQDEAVEPGGYSRPSIVVSDGTRILSSLPRPPWVEPGVNELMEVTVVGTIDWRRPDEEGFVVADDGVRWTLAPVEGTVLDSYSGARSLHTTPAPGARAEVAGFAARTAADQNRLAAVRILVLDQPSVASP